MWVIFEVFLPHVSDFLQLTDLAMLFRDGSGGCIANGAWWSQAPTPTARSTSSLKCFWACWILGSSI